MTPIDHKRAELLRGAIEAALPDLEYAVRRWQGLTDAPAGARQLPIPGHEGDDPDADNVFGTMFDAVERLAAAMRDDTWMADAAGPTMRARAALDCAIALVAHDRRCADGGAR
jgi:hypothetical protein